VTTSIGDMVYSVIKLVGVFVLAALVLVLLALGTLDETQGFAILGLLLGYVVGNASVLNVAPIIQSIKTPEEPQP